MTSANILNINDSFALQNVYKGICNVTDDVGITTLRETGLLKSLIDGSDIEVNIKHKDPIQWKPNSQFVMCCNEIPRIADSTKGMIRRLAFIPFELELEPKEMDIFLKDKILGEPGNNGLRYIMTKAILAHREAVRRGDLTILPKQKELELDFIDENKDSVNINLSPSFSRIDGIGNKMFNELVPYLSFLRVIFVDRNLRVIVTKREDWLRDLETVMKGIHKVYEKMKSAQS